MQEENAISKTMSTMSAVGLPKITGHLKSSLMSQLELKDDNLRPRDIAETSFQSNNSNSQSENDVSCSL